MKKKKKKKSSKYANRRGDKKKSTTKKGYTDKKRCDATKKFLPEYSDTIVTVLLYMTRRDGYLHARVADRFRSYLDWTKYPRVRLKTSCEQDSYRIAHNVTVSMKRFKLRQLYDQRHQLYDSKALKREKIKFYTAIDRWLPSFPRSIVDSLLTKYFDNMNMNDIMYDLVTRSKLFKFKIEKNSHLSRMRFSIYFLNRNEFAISIQIGYQWKVVS